MSIASDIGGIINAAGVATSGTNMFVGIVPDTITGLAVLLLDVGGAPATPKWNRNWWDIEVIVRSNINDYAGGWNKSISIKNLLLSHAPTTIGTNVYAAFLQRNDVTYIGQDENKRHKFATYYRIIVDGPTEGNRLEIA